MKLCRVAFGDRPTCGLIPFCDIKKGDFFFAREECIECGEDAHWSGDASYHGFLLYDKKGNSWFPEDVEREVAFV